MKAAGSIPVSLCCGFEKVRINAAKECMRMIPKRINAGFAIFDVRLCLHPSFGIGATFPRSQSTIREGSAGRRVKFAGPAMDHAGDDVGEPPCCASQLYAFRSPDKVFAMKNVVPRGEVEDLRMGVAFRIHVQDLHFQDLQGHVPESETMCVRQSGLARWQRKGKQGKCASPGQAGR